MYTYIYIHNLHMHYIHTHIHIYIYIYISVVSEIHEFHTHRLVTRTTLLREGICPFARSFYREIFLIFSSKTFSKTHAIQL
jgi:hypothetical protein